jgi:hypothetical protein
MRRQRVATVVASLAAAVSFVACGTDNTGGPRAAGGPQPEPEPSATTAPQPTGPPWPAYPVDDYDYQLRVACFCPSAGIPVTVSVRDGAVADVAYARSLRGHTAGGPVSDPWLRLTINDIIDEANDRRYATVDVRWKNGHEYPSSVSIDRIKNAVDDEIGYHLDHVRPA